MPSSFKTREGPRLELKADVADNPPLSAAESLCLHWGVLLRCAIHWRDRRRGAAFVAELAISFILMSAILFASNHQVLAPYTHYFVAILVAAYIAFESPLSGMSTNPARTFGPALYGRYWHGLWIYFIAPPLGMLAAAEVFLLARESKRPYCAKLHHHHEKRCIFRHSDWTHQRR